MKAHEMASDARIFTVIPYKMQGVNDYDFKHSCNSSNCLLNWGQNKTTSRGLVVQSSRIADQQNTLSHFQSFCSPTLCSRINVALLNLEVTYSGL